MVQTSDTRLWLPFRKPNPDARLRLFCFPYAGGGASIFRDWTSELGPEIEVCAVQLPGREQRIREPGFTRMEPLIDALETALSSCLDKPFALFGHSMGAIVAYELAARLQTRAFHPTHLLVSARRAPHVESRREPSHALPDHQFKERLRMLNGTPEEVFNDSELMQLVLPQLRSDFELNETYVPGSHELLKCPVTAFGGMADPEVEQEEIEAWRHTTRHSFQCKMFRGNHFFLHEAKAELLSSIADCLMRD